MNTKKNSFCILINSRSHTQKEDALIDQWLEWNWDRKNVGRIQSKSLSFFPFWFRREATDLTLANWDDDLVKAIGNWRQSDVALPRNRWSIPASGMDKFSAEQNQLIEILGRYPELSEAVKRAKSATDVGPLNWPQGLGWLRRCRLAEKSHRDGTA